MPPVLAPRQGLDLRIATRDGLHALRTELEWSDASSGRLCVEWPSPASRLFPVRAGQAITVELSRPGDALYSLETLLESASTEEPPHLVLRPVGDWQRLERRESVRQPVEMHPTRAARLHASGPSEPFVASLGDLSSGGLRLLTSLALEAGDRLELTFATPSGGAELRVRLSVVRAAPATPGQSEAAAVGAQPAWAVGCQFVEPSPAEREQIVQFILAQQWAVARNASQSEKRRAQSRLTSSEKSVPNSAPEATSPG